jgi:type III secretion protein Q
VRSRNAGSSAAMNMMADPVAGYRPACLSAEYAALARSLSRRRFTRNLGGFGLQVVAPPDVIADPVALDMLPDAQMARVTIPRLLLHHLLETLDPAAPGAVPDVACLLLELYLEPLLTRLETNFPSLAVRLSPANSETRCAAFAIGLAVRHGAIADTLRLDLDLAAGRSVAAALAHLPDWRGAMPDLPIQLHLRALCADVSLVELRAARPGDVVLADALPDGEILVIAGECLPWRARYDGPRLQVITPRLRPRAIGLVRWVMSDAIEPDDAADLDELPVRLSFELGRLELLLAEVAVLGPGHVFELAREEAQPVDILANGRRVGRGRIVTVAGSIGVQIVRIGRE